MATTTATPSIVYTEENMRTLRDSDHIRINPGMYIGNTDANGLYHLAQEAVSNSVNEAVAGYCKSISVTLRVDGRLEVSDDGRGIPVEINPRSGRSWLEEFLTVCGTSGRLDETPYRLVIGLHGVGAKVITALSEWCEVEVKRDGWLHRMVFERGVAVGALARLGPIPRNLTGTTVTFKPDPEIFGSATFDATRLVDRLRQLAFLYRGLRLSLTHEVTGTREEFFAPDGATDYVRWLNRDATPLHEAIQFRRTFGEIMIDVALQWTASENAVAMCFVNGDHAWLGGTPITGLRTGIKKALMRFQDHCHPRRQLKKFDKTDIQEGLTAVVSVRHPDPHWEFATKSSIANPGLVTLVSGTVASELANRFVTDLDLGRRIWDKCKMAKQVRRTVSAIRTRQIAARRKR